jgi:hypothetical protein
MSITLSDVLSDAAFLQQKETIDRDMFTAIQQPDLQSIRSKLAVWAASQFNGTCELIQILMTPPSVCSDGASRTLLDYITFLSGSTIEQHTQSIQTIVPEFELGYQYTHSGFTICAYGLKK